MQWSGINSPNNQNPSCITSRLSTGAAKEKRSCRSLTRWPLGCLDHGVFAVAISYVYFCTLAYEEFRNCEVATVGSKHKRIRTVVINRLNICQAFCQKCNSRVVAPLSRKHKGCSSTTLARFKIRSSMSQKGNHFVVSIASSYQERSEVFVFVGELDRSSFIK